MKKKLPECLFKKKKPKKFFLKKNKDYFITSFTCFIKLDITKRKNYKKVHEVSEICRIILSSSFDAPFTLDKVIFIKDKTGFFNKELELKIE